MVNCSQNFGLLPGRVVKRQVFFLSCTGASKTTTFLHPNGHPVVLRAVLKSVCELQLCCLLLLCRYDPLTLCNVILTVY